ncbi:hypothetical protein NC653_004372 [Populus alba x Populus x berolinensis]|uniref:Uncharacterized protein n=1 Tax=Populus alba x Populus x berolinensis TaxID=444605 RepID=A0AAD6RUP1_9ROSI|nr:hypothetical protein NC653_004372 [Populus alba x Populus x berolinensis]
MEIVRKEEDGGDEEEEELKTILFYQFEYIPNQTPKVYFGAKENGEQMDLDQAQCQNEAWDGEVEVELHIQSDGDIISLQEIDQASIISIYPFIHLVGLLPLLFE